MNKLFRLGGLLAALLLSASVHAGDIRVEGAWARATAPGQDAGMADLTLTSKQAATLVAVSSTVSNSVEMHSMTHEGGMMKMREVKAIALPAGQRVNLGDSGYHLMLIGLKAPLKAGDSVPLTLKVEVAGKVASVEAKAEIRAMGGGQHGHHGH